MQTCAVTAAGYIGVRHTSADLHGLVGRIWEAPGHRGRNVQIQTNNICGFSGPHAGCGEINAPLIKRHPLSTKSDFVTLRSAKRPLKVLKQLNLAAARLPHLVMQRGDVTVKKSLLLNARLAATKNKKRERDYQQTSGDGTLSTNVSCFQRGWSQSSALNLSTACLSRRLALRAWGRGTIP